MTPYAVLWGATWGNNVAAVEWVVAVSVAGALLRRPLARLTRAAKRALLAEVHAHAAQAREDAQAARRIAADLYRHQTGRHHPDALPPPKATPPYPARGGSDARL